jgi:hypothetical protein
MAWVEIMLPSARTLPTGKLTQNPIRTGERRCILYVGDDSGITLAWDHATHPWTIGPLVRSKTLRERAERAERERDQAQREHDRLQRETDRLRQQIDHLKRQVDEARRAGFRQAAPFAKPLKTHPQRPDHQEPEPT